MIKEIENDILKAYGSLDNPNFRFEEDTTRQKMYEPFMRDLAAALAPYLLDVLGFYKICNFTDVNTDHGYLFTLGAMDELWLQLSFVGSYAVLMRNTPDTMEVIDPSGDRIPIETCIIDLLAVHDIRLLDKNTLEIPIGLKLFETDPENVRVYQALFSDVDILPWDPVPKAFPFGSAPMFLPKSTFETRRSPGSGFLSRYPERNPHSVARRGDQH